MSELANPSISRRSVVVHGGQMLLAFSVGGSTMMLSAADGRAAAAELCFMTRVEFELIEALGEALVPGAREAGIGHFVDHMLNQPDSSCLLTIRYLDVVSPYGLLYRQGLARLLQLVAPKKPLTVTHTTIQHMLNDDSQFWPEISAFLFYFAVRGDAMDVVYGTPQGPGRLGLPSMEHIKPPPFTDLTPMRRR